MSARWSDSGWAESRPLRDCQRSDSFIAGACLLSVVLVAALLIAASLVLS